MVRNISREPLKEAVDPAPARLCLVVMGNARLPKSMYGEQPGSLMIELAFDSDDGRIVDVATSIALPRYAALLRSLLIGRRLDEVERAAKTLAEYLRGPLLKPTIAALASAVSNCERPVSGSRPSP